MDDVPSKKDPIVSPTDNTPRRAKKRRAGYLLVLGIVIVALLVLIEWLVNGTIIFSNS